MDKRLAESDALLQQTSNEIEASIQTVRQKTDDYYYHKAVSAIIASLSFPGMNERFERVVDAHADTYSWIFEFKSNSDQCWDSFISWLEQEHVDPIYWVSGKAASGKSTLMRYIIENQWKLCKSLDAWTQGRQLMIPNFFFWSTGTAMQKSQNGLFRSLLHQIFSQDPTLVQEALPDLVHSTLPLPESQLSQVENRVWSLNELKQTLCSLIKQDNIPTCYCLLIDGLDEYDGDYLELSMFLKVISTCSNVKLCLSSRPLLALEHHFNGFPKLRLQDLTLGDISRFVRDKLEEHPRFYALAQMEPRESSSLISEIVQTSCGVFLWVSLVVKSLSEGLTNHDGLSDLQRRLRELPPELEGLYGTMLNSISPPFYREQASRLLQLVYQSPAPLTLAELSFADDEDEDLAFKTKIGSITTLELACRARAMEPRLKSRCAGLLEVQRRHSGLQNLEEWPSGYVRYLHLTVKEYLEKPDVCTSLLALTNSSGFNASISLLRSKLLILKYVDFFMSPRDVEEVIYLVLQAEDSMGVAQTALLEAIDTTVSLAAFARNESNGGHWLSYLLHMGTSFHKNGQSRRSGCHWCDRCPCSLITFAVRNGLTLFVRDFIRRSRGLKRSCGERSLLDYATWYDSGDQNMPPIRPSMVAMLFEEGLRPNDASCGSTPWRDLLGCLATVKGRVMLSSPWSDVCKLFVLFGADVKVGCMHKGKWKSTSEVLESAFQYLPGDSFQELKRMVLDRGGGSNLGRHRPPKDQHHRNRHQNRHDRTRINLNYLPSSQQPSNHPQDLHDNDQTVAYYRSRTSQYPKIKAERYDSWNAKSSNRYREHSDRRRHSSPRRSFISDTDSAMPSIPLRSQRWRPY